MKETIFVFLLLFAMQCKDQDFEPQLLDELQGKWVRTDDDTRKFIFGPDYATTWIYNFSTVIAPKWYRIEQTGERDLMLIEVNKNDTLRWRFSDIDGTVTVADATHYPTFYFNLKRE